ncbi:MAG: hypothetical protein R3F11_07975 [Verrucomicrobiales bacterium]
MDGIVLIRALEPTTGVAEMQARRKREALRDLCSYSESWASPSAWTGPARCRFDQRGEARRGRHFSPPGRRRTCPRSRRTSGSASPTVPICPTATCSEAAPSSA